MNLLVFEEGRVVLSNGLHVAYRDSKGIATIGYGFNLQDGAAAGVLRLVTTKTTADLIEKTQFLTEEEAQSLLLLAENVAITGVRSFFPDFDAIDLPRRVVLASMVYQFGAGGFGKFRRLIPAVEGRDWPTTVLSMEQSQWYKSDSPKRARRMAEAVRSGSFPASAILSADAPRDSGVPAPSPQPGTSSPTGQIAYAPSSIQRSGGVVRVNTEASGARFVVSPWDVW